MALGSSLHRVAWFHYNSAFETDLMIDAGSWWTLMPDSDSPWLMHMVSPLYQTIIIKEKVQIVGELRYQERGGLETICHELSGFIKAESRAVETQWWKKWNKWSMCRYACANSGGAYSFRCCHYITIVVAEGPLCIVSTCVWVLVLQRGWENLWRHQ